MDEQAGRNRKRRGVRSLWPIAFRRPEAEAPENDAPEPTRPGITVATAPPSQPIDDATMRPSFFAAVTQVDALARLVANEPWDDDAAGAADRDTPDDRELLPRRAPRSERAVAPLGTEVTALHAAAPAVDTVVTELATVVVTQASDAARRRASLAQLEMMPLYESDAVDADPVVLDGGGARLALENRILSVPWPEANDPCRPLRLSVHCLTAELVIDLDETVLAAILRGLQAPACRQLVAWEAGGTETEDSPLLCEPTSSAAAVLLRMTQLSDDALCAAILASPPGAAA
ncbi:MAG TPA: hypothetical protein VFH51_08230, partial [Myxococcota bacterium]|nr:hypothetical protein [Myxococcota bacterium]